MEGSVDTFSQVWSQASSCMCCVAAILSVSTHRLLLGFIERVVKSCLQVDWGRCMSSGVSRRWVLIHLCVLKTFIKLTKKTVILSFAWILPQRSSPEPLGLFYGGNFGEDLWWFFFFGEGHRRVKHKPNEKHYYRVCRIKIKQVVEEIMPGLTDFICFMLASLINLF